MSPISADGLRMRDEESLQLIAEQGAILGRVHDLRDVAPIRVWSIDPETHGFRFEAPDGSTWTIDPTTLAPSRLPEALETVPEPDVSPAPGVDFSRAVRTASYEFNGRKRRAPLERNGVTLHPEHTYLAAEVVPQVQHWPRILVLERVLERDADDGGYTLWCLLLDGSVDWKVTGFDGTVLAAKLYRDTVVLATKRRLVALRAEDGTMVWTSPP